MGFKKSKIYNWEFWPFWIFYIPVYVKYIWYTFRTGSPLFFAAANPLMEIGGFAAYSKHRVLSKVPNQYLPKTTLVNPPFSIPEFKKVLDELDFTYPVILKPDKGERGFGVEKIDQDQDLEVYLKSAKHDLIIQEYIDYPIELGIMYHRMPDEETGHITSIVQKDFLHVIGDGTSTLKTLFEKGNRTKRLLEKLNADFIDQLDIIPKKGDVIELEPIGNHVRGTTFLNANYLINDQLTKVINDIALEIPDFFFGRFDLRVKSMEDLFIGQHIKIMEVNGANSEPAHIYDPETKLIEAYKHLFKHWRILFLISRQNHQKGVQYPPFFSTYKQIRQYYKTR